MFKNLRAELARSGIEQKDIAECIKVNERTVRCYLTGETRIPWSYALKIKRTFFPDLNIEYLFELSENQAS